MRDWAPVGSKTTVMRSLRVNAWLTGAWGFAAKGAPANRERRRGEPRP